MAFERAKAASVISPRKTSWTPEDNERLKEMVANGVPILRAAASFKCTMSAVRVQARKLGTPFPSLRETRKKFASDPQATWQLPGSYRKRAAPKGDIT